MRRSERFKPAADLTRARASARYDGILAARSPVNNRNGLGFQNALSRTPPVICVARLYRSTSRLSLIGLSRSIPRGGRREKRYVPCVYERYGPMCSSLSPSEHVMRYSKTRKSILIKEQQCLFRSDIRATTNSSAIHDRSTNGVLDSIEIVRGHVLLCGCLSAYRYFISRR
ncbi:hypothetical protein ALC53_07812 [Atta colombica]|uniref:Uncharacterized protein n=1 Tax=Atta colombica TaxID=520822 RepID=A0A195BBA9_9HYME|nr:hypothetical protein ALC53_07812 [Atta colombica]